MGALRNKIENTDFGTQSDVDRYNELVGEFNQKIEENKGRIRPWTTGRGTDHTSKLESNLIQFHLFNLTLT